MTRIRQIDPADWDPRLREAIKPEDRTPLEPSGSVDESTVRTIANGSAAVAGGASISSWMPTISRPASGGAPVSGSIVTVPALGLVTDVCTGAAAVASVPVETVPPALTGWLTGVSVQSVSQPSPLTSLPSSHCSPSAI